MGWASVLTTRRSACDGADVDTGHRAGGMMGAMDTQQIASIEHTAMEHFTRADYDLAFAEEQELVDTQADRVLDWLRQMDTPSRYQINRLEHSLQSATRAER